MALRNVPRPGDAEVAELVVEAPSVFSEGDGLLVADNGRLKVTFEVAGGSVVGVRNLLTGQELLDEAEEPGPPWGMLRQVTHSSARPALPFRPDSLFRRDEPDEFSFEIDESGRAASLRWTSDRPGVGVRVRVVLEPDGDLELWPDVDVEDGVRPPESLTYPVLRSPARIGADAGDDRLVFPMHSGWLIRNPLGSLRHYEGEYPSAIVGCSLQALGYFAEGTGGFYVATHDPTSTHKSFRFSGGELSVRHDHWDLRPGVSMNLGYPVVIAPLVRGDWYEVAERYRGWALDNAPWVAGGPKWGREDSGFARWLHEEVGLCVWGAPSSVDWSPWYRSYAEAAGTPIHVVSGWDWPASKPHALGYEGWFPASFDDKNIEAWKGHRVTPYMNDQFVSYRAQNFHTEWEPNLIFPYRSFSFAGFSEPRPEWISGDAPGPNPDVTTDVDFFICPVTDAQEQLHVWRDLNLVRDNDLDGVLFDISAGFAPLRCLRATHGHPPGYAQELVEAYDRNNRLSKQAILEATGTYPAHGNETIIENLVGSVDFYTARACAGPLGHIEAYVPAPEEPPGEGRELIPLFQAVYHDYGPVHQDGWLQLSKRSGELFFWIAARITLQWGGMVSLQYASNCPERIEGVEQPAVFISWDGTAYEFSQLPEADPAKRAFCAEIAQARTGFGNRYLGYGQIVRPVGVGTPRISADYELFYEQIITGGRRRGSWQIPQVLEAAWRDPLGNLGLFFVNLHPEDPHKVEIDAEVGERWALDGRGCRVRTLDAGGAHDQEVIGDDNRLRTTLTLEPRRIRMVELSCGMPAGQGQAG